MVEWSLANLAAWAVQAAGARGRRRLAPDAAAARRPARPRSSCSARCSSRASRCRSCSRGSRRPRPPAACDRRAGPPIDLAASTRPARPRRTGAPARTRRPSRSERPRAAGRGAAVGRDRAGRARRRRGAAPRLARRSGWCRWPGCGGRRRQSTRRLPSHREAERAVGACAAFRESPRVPPPGHLRPPAARRPRAARLHGARPAAAAGDCLPRTAARAAAGLAPRARRRAGARAALVPPGHLVARRADPPERRAADRPRGGRPRRRPTVVPARAAGAGRSRRRPAAPAGGLFPGSRPPAAAGRDADGGGVYVPPSPRRFGRARLCRPRHGRLGCRPGVPAAGGCRRRASFPCRRLRPRRRSRQWSPPPPPPPAAAKATTPVAPRSTAAAAGGAAPGHADVAPKVDEATLKQSIQPNPKDTSNYFILAKLYEDAGDLARAVATLEAAVKAAPQDPNVYLQLAGFYNRHGDFPKTMDALTRWAAVEPGNPVAHHTMAAYYWEKAYRDCRAHRRPRSATTSIAGCRPPTGRLR